MSPLELVIFDCDGVLVDSEPIAIRVDAMVLADLGWPLSEAEIIERFVERSEEHFVHEIEAYLGHPLPGNWDDTYQHLYSAAFEKELRPVDGVVEALDQITTATCVASSGGHAKIRRSLRLTNLYERFEGAFSVPAKSPMESLHPTCFSTRRRAWACRPHDAPSWKTAATASKPPGRRAWRSSVTPAA